MAVATLPTAPTPTHRHRGRSDATRSARDLRGRLITAGDADYDDARRSALFHRRPPPAGHRARGGRARTSRQSVNFARDHSLPLAVRSGGHSLAHLSVIDDAIVVDLSEMARVSIDPEARIARVQPGATSGDLAGPANDYGLALSTGDTHSVGMGGLTTGGGIGFMVRKYGLAIDNLLAAQVVTADGEIVTASAERAPGPLLGDPRRRRQRRHRHRVRVPPGARRADSGRRADAARQSRGPARLPRLRGLGARRPDDDREPDVCAAGAPRARRSASASWCSRSSSAGRATFAAGERALAPLRALATPVADAVAPIPYPEIYRFTEHQAAPHAASIRMMFADELSDAALDAALAAMERASSPFSLIQFRGLGGAMARVADDATAFAHRQRRYFVAIIGLWLDPAEDPAVHEAWTAALWQAHPPRGVRRLRQLPGGGRPGPRARGLPAGHLRPAGGDQAALRPGEPLPVQPERPTRAGRRRRVRRGWLGGRVAGRTPPRHPATQSPVTWGPLHHERSE